jgi:hypothetical protein
MTNTITKITYDWDDYKVWAEYTAGSWISIDANNEISSTVSWVPTVWSNGQVLTVVSWASAWANLPSDSVQVSSQANNILTSWMKIRAGEETDYANLGTYDNNTLYLTVPDSN